MWEVLENLGQFEGEFSKLQ